MDKRFGRYRRLGEHATGRGQNSFAGSRLIRDLFFLPQMVTIRMCPAWWCEGSLGSGSRFGSRPRTIRHHGDRGMERGPDAAFFRTVVGARLSAVSHRIGRSDLRIVVHEWRDT